MQTLNESPGEGWIKNDGRRPEGMKRVRVWLRKGAEPTYADVLNAMAPPGWDPKTTRWTLRNDPHDVIWYLPL